MAERLWLITEANYLNLLRNRPFGGEGAQGVVMGDPAQEDPSATKPRIAFNHEYSDEALADMDAFIASQPPPVQEATYLSPSLPEDWVYYGSVDAAGTKKA